MTMLTFKKFNGMKKMNLRSYIDTCIIRDYAEKDFIHGYSLHINQLPPHEQQNFLDFLFENDPVMKEMAKERMQQLIDERISFVECEDRYEAGLYPKIDSASGETKWEVR